MDGCGEPMLPLVPNIVQKSTKRLQKLNKFSDDTGVYRLPLKMLITGD